MKKILTLLLVCLIHEASILAVPAKPGWHTVTQSDGTTLKVQSVGNAFNNAILTTDGLTVARGENGDFYYYSSITGITTTRAHEPALRTSAEKAFVTAQRGAMTMQHKQYKKIFNHKGKITGTGSNATADVPAMGQRRIPIILVEFKDKKFSNNMQAIVDAMLRGHESVGQYYSDQSNGMYEPIFDVFGIYCLSKNREEYGGHNGTVKDKGIGWMVTEACELASADGVSFKPYDTNGDYYCDVVIIIYAGVGEAQASIYHPETIWPCNWTLESAQYYSRGGNGAFSPAPDDPYVNHFAVFNELHGSNDNGKTIDGIGTFVHEFGHCLGLPDLYDTGNNDNYGMGNWDVMCLGNYANDGYTPVGFSAYEKVFMGWVDYMKPEPNTYVTLPVWNQKKKDTDKAVCAVSNINRNEYFIFENRRRTGWDRYLPGQGIMVTHVIYSANDWYNNKVNNGDIQLFTLLPADNKFSKYSEGGDLWPNGSRREVTDNSTPATVLHMNSFGGIVDNAGYLGKPVTEMVINSDGTASFWYMKQPDPVPTIQVSASSINFENVAVNSTDTCIIHVSGQDLKDNITVMLSDEVGAFAINDDVIHPADAAAGKHVTITFKPSVAQEFFAKLTLSSQGAQDVVINLAGTSILPQDDHCDNKLGDVNHDKKMDVEDVTILIKHLLGWDVDCCSICGNVNEDDILDIEDVALLIKRLLGQMDKL